MMAPTPSQPGISPAGPAVQRAGTGTPIPGAGPRQELVIRDWLPPQVTNQSRQRHWATVSREVAGVKLVVWGAAKNAGWRPVIGKAQLTVVFVHHVKRRRDTDNTYARAKHVVDGLVEGGWLRDDSTEWLDLVVRAEVRPGVRQTELLLEALP